MSEPDTLAITEPAHGSSLFFNNGRFISLSLIITAAVAIVALVLAAISLRSTNVNISLGGQSISDAFAGNRTVQPDQRRIWTIHVGHDYAPFEYLNAHGRTDGFNIDLIREVCKVAGMTCHTVYHEYKVCWDTIPGKHPVPGPALMARWVDACSGWYVAPERLNTLAFTDPFMKPILANFIVMRLNPGRFDPNDIQGKKIGFLDGWVNDEKCVRSQNDIRHNQLSLTQIKHYKDQSDLFAALDKGEVDAGFHSVDATVDLTRYEWIGKKWSCMIRGLSMLVRKDSPVPTWWNPALKKVRDSGVYKKLCDEAPQKHAPNAVDLSFDCLD